MDQNTHMYTTTKTGHGRVYKTFCEVREFSMSIDKGFSLWIHEVLTNRKKVKGARWYLKPFKCQPRNQSSIRVKRTCFAPENTRKNSMFFRFRIVTEVLANDCQMDQQLWINLKVSVI